MDKFEASKTRSSFDKLRMNGFRKASANTRLA